MSELTINGICVAKLDDNQTQQLLALCQNAPGRVDFIMITPREVQAAEDRSIFPIIKNLHQRVDVRVEVIFDLADSSEKYKP